MSKSPRIKKKKKSLSTSTNDVTLKDPLPVPTWLPPPPELGTKLLQAVDYHPLDDKDLFGLKISSRVLKHLSPAEVRDLVEVFQTFDREEKCMLKPTELYYAMKVLGFRMSKKECDEYVAQETEYSNAKGIDINSFLELIIDKQHTSKDNFEEIINGFKLFDFDKTGLITLDNLRQACIEADLSLTDTELKEMIQEADQNGDALIDQQEFIQIMLRTNLYSV